MNFDRPMPPHRVPTLTEVVVWPEPVLETPVPEPTPEPISSEPIAEPVTVETAPEPVVESIENRVDVELVESADLPRVARSAEAANPVEAGPPAIPGPAPLAVLPTEDQLTQRVLADIQRQVELMLDYRLREALAPLLARATDGLVRDARQELASTLRDVVARAVAQELSRHRTR